MNDSATAAVKDRVLTIVQRATQVPLEGDLDAIGLHHLGIDSAGMINVIVAIEDAFDLDVEDEYIHRLRTVGDIVRAIEAAT